VAGWFVGNGLTSIRTADRFVTVKGVSERQVKSDLALWPIQLAVTDDNVAIAQNRVNQNVSRWWRFSRRTGSTRPRSSSRASASRTYWRTRTTPESGGNRFIIQQTVMVRSIIRIACAPQARRWGSW